MISHHISRKIFVVNCQLIVSYKISDERYPHSISSITVLYIVLKEFMTQSHDRKNMKISDALSSENSHITYIFTWRGYIFLGSLLFMIFYWMIPSWLNHELSTLHNSTIRPIAETLFMRRIHWIQLAGIALGSIFIFLLFAIIFLINQQRQRKQYQFL